MSKKQKAQHAKKPDVDPVVDVPMASLRELGANSAPSMPVFHENIEHRPRSEELAGISMVAKVINKKEVEKSPAAKAAMAKERQALRDLKTWDESAVEEWDVVADRSRRAGARVHVGRVFGFVSIKNSELPEGHPNRKYKGRAVFQGNQVRDEDNYQALFQDLGSSPASMAAGKLVDFAGLLAGCAP